MLICSRQQASEEAQWVGLLWCTSRIEAFFFFFFNNTIWLYRESPTLLSFGCKLCSTGGCSTSCWWVLQQLGNINLFHQVFLCFCVVKKYVSAISYLTDAQSILIPSVLYYPQGCKVNLKWKMTRSWAFLPCVANKRLKHSRRLIGRFKCNKLSSLKHNTERITCGTACNTTYNWSSTPKSEWLPASHTSIWAN